MSLYLSDLLLQIICHIFHPSVTRKVDRLVENVCQDETLWQMDIRRGRSFVTIFRCVTGGYKPVAELQMKKQKRGCMTTSSFLSYEIHYLLMDSSIISIFFKIKSKSALSFSTLRFISCTRPFPFFEVLFKKPKLFS